MRLFAACKNVYGLLFTVYCLIKSKNFIIKGKQ